LELLNGSTHAVVDDSARDPRIASSEIEGFIEDLVACLQALAGAGPRLRHDVQPEVEGSLVECGNLGEQAGACATAPLDHGCDQLVSLPCTMHVASRRRRPFVGQSELTGDLLPLRCLFIAELLQPLAESDYVHDRDRQHGERD
jgi:hypothetical protein